jgi:phosphate:Na+ symporter
MPSWSESLRLGLTVFLRGDAALREARQLVVRKRLLRRLETEAADTNIRSLQGTAEGVLAAGVDSGIFLRIVRDLRRVHSHIAALAYPVLERAVGGADRSAAPAPVGDRRFVVETAPVTDPGDRH